LTIVKKIPKGRLMTYKVIAKKLHSSPRAVAKALSMNPHPTKMPCFRVVLSNGKIGGYNRGKKKKAELLRKEGAVIKKGKILNFAKKAIFN